MSANARRRHESLDDDSPDATRLRARQILLQNERLELQLAVMRGEYVRAADVEHWGSELGAAVREVVTQIHPVAPSVVGLAVADAEVRLKEVEDEVPGQLHTLSDRFSSARQH